MDSNFGLPGISTTSPPATRTRSIPRLPSPDAHTRSGKFRELHGVDVSARSIELAAAQHPLVHYSTFDGSRLPYRDGQFSIAFTVCAMHHVPLPQGTSFAVEIFQ
jgi:hypothetical protein